MKIKILLSALLITFLFVGKAEAVETFGVMDIINRVPGTNMSGEHIKYFHNARHEMLAELDILTIPGEVEFIDWGNEFKTAVITEQEIMQQLGSNQITQTKYAQCNYIMFMYLTNCNEVKDDRVLKKSNIIKVDMSARIIERRSGKCVFVATGSGESKAKDYRVLGLLKFQTFECPEEQFYDAMKAAIHEIAAKIKERM